VIATFSLAPSVKKEEEEEEEEEEEDKSSAFAILIYTRGRNPQFKMLCKFDFFGGSMTNG